MSDTLKAVAHPAVLPLVCLAIGLVVGSFLNVVVHRLPKMMERSWREECAELQTDLSKAGEPSAPKTSETYNLFVPRSRCPACGHGITPLENIPILSWAVLRGRCSACKTRISARYPVVELLGGIAAAWSAWRFGFTPAAFGAMIFMWCIIAASVIDLDTQLLPDSITLPLLWLGLLFNAGGVFTDLRSAVIGAA
ncbi:MAG TPA: prepilin peptidase, partial [Burkholderiales bacterium]|nr:prepilin peptidase [Burkholderiales bacterium]